MVYRASRVALITLMGLVDPRHLLTTSLTPEHSMIDLTTLEGQDTPGKVRQLCQKAIHLHDAMPGLPHVAAVCVYPTMVGVAKEALRGTGINVASVATAFPSGQSKLSVKLDDTRMAVAAGADEIDMVISRGRFHGGSLWSRGSFGLC